MDSKILSSLVIKNKAKIIFLILDGLGGMPFNSNIVKSKTELETANIPNIEKIMQNSICGLLDPIEIGITPGSGPAHFALFGYDYIETSQIGRGLLEAAGINWLINRENLFIRGNFATINKDGIIIDRRAGRIDTEYNKQICQKLQNNIKIDSSIKLNFEPLKDHRFLLVLDGNNLSEMLTETDPQVINVKPLELKPLIPTAEKTAVLLTEIILQTKYILFNEKKSNTILLRGYSKYKKISSLYEKYGLNALAITTYPMYKGVSRLLGMKIASTIDDSLKSKINILKKNYLYFDFFFIHIKNTDLYGENGDFFSKVKMIEEVDTYIPDIINLNPEVFVLTGDHSTPSKFFAHSWHPVPVLLYSKNCRPDKVKNFGERDCINGEIGRMPAIKLMQLILAHAMKLKKFGA